jgi:hypothetical protein
MKWVVEFFEEFAQEFAALSPIVQTELLAHAKLLEAFGPSLGRPWVDTLSGSRHSNMKELRFNADQGAWRVAFAFDSRRQAIILVAGDKAGTNQKRFYQRLIRMADTRFDAHVVRLDRQ